MTTRHYGNTPIQCAVIFDKFQMKICCILLIFAQNTDCGLNHLIKVVLKSFYDLCFE